MDNDLRYTYTPSDITIKTIHEVSSDPQRAEKVFHEICDLANKMLGAIPVGSTGEDNLRTAAAVMMVVDFVAAQLQVPLERVIPEIQLVFSLWIKEGCPPVPFLDVPVPPPMGDRA